MWTIFLKSLLNLLQYCFCFMFWFFGPEACGILAPRTGIEPTPPALEGKVLATGPPGKSQGQLIFDKGAISFNGERIVFSTNSAGTTGYPHGKE